MEGAPRAESDSVAAHSYFVALLSYLTALQLSRDFPEIQWQRVLAMGVLHDLSESITGEFESEFKRRIGATPGWETLIDDLEDKVARFLLEDLEGGKDLTALVREFAVCQTKEAKIVKFADILDAFAHAKVHLGKTFDKYLSVSRQKLEKDSPVGDRGVGNLLAEWLDAIVSDWDDIVPKGRD